MKASFVGLFLVMMCGQWTHAQQTEETSPASAYSEKEQELIELSRDKWLWMAEKKADTLAALFHDKAQFVHMGGTWGKEQEVDIIRSGRIHYKQADIHEVMVALFENTGIIWNRITLLAVVGGNEVANPFMVTEVYVRQDGAWKLGSMSFSRLMGG